MLLFACSPTLPVVLPASTGQGLQIRAQLIRKDGQIYYSILFENNSQVPLDGFMIQFNKNTFGLASAGPLQVPVTFKPKHGFFYSLTSCNYNCCYSGPTSATWVICQNSSSHGFVPECSSWSTKHTFTGCREKCSATCVVLQ